MDQFPAMMRSVGAVTIPMLTTEKQFEQMQRSLSECLDALTYVALATEARRKTLALSPDSGDRASRPDHRFIEGE